MGLTIPHFSGPDQREPGSAELPLPVLDGGHPDVLSLGGCHGQGVSDAWMERLQRGGVAVLLAMMSSLFNDITWLFGYRLCRACLQLRLPLHS